MPASRNPLFTRIGRGEQREQQLEQFRNSLRVLIDPTTGVEFEEEEIRRATLQGSRYWVEAESDDLMIQVQQKRAEFIAQQVDPRRSATAWLAGFHAPSLGAPRLQASGGSGEVMAVGQPGTTYVGSTTLPDTLASYCTIRGMRFQVLFTVVVPASGEAPVVIQGVDVGPATNLEEGDVVVWGNPPAGSELNATVRENFSGGTNVETAEEWGERLFSLKSIRPKNGNAAHFRAWSRESTNAVQDAFVYPCVFDTDSVMVCLTQKRGGVVGPLARIPSIGTLTVVQGRIVPPGSQIVPGGVMVLVTGPQAVDCDVAIGLPLRKNSQQGWLDPSPWPRYTSNPSQVQSVTSQVLFRINSDVSLPAVGTPSLMLWDNPTSRFVKLTVSSVTYISGTTYEVALAIAPADHTIAAGDRVSPYTPRHTEIAQGIETYFDSLGPGEAFSLTGDARSARAYRRPRPEREAPYDADGTVLDYVEEALGTRFFGEQLLVASPSTVGTTVQLAQGPRMLVAGRAGIYPVG